MKTIEVKFDEMKDLHFSKEQRNKGFMTIIRNLRPIAYFKITWELFTSLIVYSPGVSNFLKEVIMSARRSWSSLSDHDQCNLIAALAYMNKGGKIERALVNF